MQDMYSRHRIHSVQDSPSLSLGLARLNKYTRLGPGPQTSDQPPPASRVLVARPQQEPGSPLAMSAALSARRLGPIPCPRSSPSSLGLPLSPRPPGSPPENSHFLPSPARVASGLRPTPLFLRGPGVGWRVKVGLSSPFSLLHPVLATRVF